MSQQSLLETEYSKEKQISVQIFNIKIFKNVQRIQSEIEQRNIENTE